MSNRIMNVIYGVPLTEAVRCAVTEYLDQNPNGDEAYNWNPVYPDTFGFERLDSNNGPEGGYCGILLKSIVANDAVPFSVVSHIVSCEQQKEVEAMIAQLHPAILDCIEKIDVWIVWSDS